MKIEARIKQKHLQKITKNLKKYYKILVNNIKIK